ncbi:T9SS type A sorting domain-containing protein, partial [bacterium]
SKQLNYNTVTQMLTVNNQNITSNNYLQIYNLNGVEVKKVKITQLYQEINLYNLERGFYIIRYGNSIEKIIIQ